MAPSETAPVDATTPMPILTQTTSAPIRMRPYPWPRETGRAPVVCGLRSIAATRDAEPVTFSGLAAGFERLAWREDYTWLRFYSAPGGFVAVTPIERVGHRHRSLNPRRIIPAGFVLGELDFWESATAPFVAPPGNYRYFAFAVTDRVDFDLRPEEEFKLVDGTEIYERGREFPDQLDTALPPGTHVYAFVYNFVRPPYGEADKPRSWPNVADQLENAGFAELAGRQCETSVASLRDFRNKTLDVKILRARHESLR
tara:strand:+ start:1138 stop:1905 length:768 start_codon:yes stop_codon:yes gene_type:complete